MIKRNFCFSRIQLIERAESLAATCKRDLSDLRPYGFDQNLLDDLISYTSKFSNFTADKTNLDNITLSNQKRKQIRKQIIGAVRLIQLRLETVAGNQNDFYLLLKNLKLHNVDDDVFFNELRKVQGSGVQICQTGVSASLTGTLNRNINDYRVMTENFNKYSTLRKETSLQRTAMANALMEKMVLISKIGKLCWRYSDSLKYNDYVLY